MDRVSHDDSLREVRTVAISGSTNPLELVPARVDRRPIVTHLWFTAAGATNLEFNSFNGSTDTPLSGIFAANTTTTPNTWGGNGAPVLVGRAMGDSIRTDNSGTVALVGFAVVEYARI